MHWAETNSLCLNPNKTYVLPISKRKLVENNIPSLYIGAKPIAFVSKITNLGFVINSNLTCVDHINMVMGKVYCALRSLRHSSWFTPINVRRKLAIQLLIPNLTYSALIYNRLDSQSAHKVEVGFNNITRYVHGLRKFDHISQLRYDLLGCQILDYIEARSCIFLYRLMLTKRPSYLYEKLKLTKSSRLCDLIVPSFNSLASTRLFFVNTIRTWNSIPTAIRSSINKGNYRTVIYNYFSRPI